ncbi:MAG: VWA domain-containing protein [Pseudomonadota bacterium]
MTKKTRAWPTVVAAGGLPIAISIFAACCGHLAGAVLQPAARASSPTPIIPATAPPDAHAIPDPALADGVARDGVRLTTRLDRGAVLSSGDGLVRLEVDIQDLHEPVAGARRATDLVVVLDESGSMGGQKIEDARAAARGLLAQLGPEDRFALVSFDSDAQVRIPLGWATDEARRGWLRRIAAIDAGGGTEMQAGLALGAEQLSVEPGRAARTILISDGQPNSRDGLDSQARGFARREVPLTTVGIGADYDEQLMASLADAGTGNFYWVQAQDDLAAVFSRELSTAQDTVATGLQVGLDLGSGVSVVDASGYPVSVVGSHATFDVGSLYASQHRSFWVTLRVPVGAEGSRDVAAASLAWSAPDTGLARIALPAERVVVVTDHATFLASVDQDAWGQAVVQEEYSVLQQVVSRAVSTGDKEAAQRAIATYRARNEELNEGIQSAVVRDNLATLDSLENDVQQQFEGAQQAERQNLFSKTLNSLSYQGRRSGQY